MSSAFATNFMTIHNPTLFVEKLEEKVLEIMQRRNIGRTEAIIFLSSKIGYGQRQIANWTKGLTPWKKDIPRILSLLETIEPVPDNVPKLNKKEIQQMDQVDLIELGRIIGKLEVRLEKVEQECKFLQNRNQQIEAIYRISHQ